MSPYPQFTPSAWHKLAPLLASILLVVCLGLAVIAAWLAIQQADQDTQDTVLAQHRAELALVCTRQEALLRLVDRVAIASIVVGRYDPGIRPAIKALEATPCSRNPR